MNFRSVGVIISKYSKISHAPPQGKGVSEIRVYDEFSEGLKDIEMFSHLHIFYWLHGSEGFTLSVKTPWDTKEHGLFATRTPRRPSPIGYAVVELIKRKGNVLKVRGLDAIDGTKVLDIKPYVPSVDSKAGANSGWLRRRIKC